MSLSIKLGVGVGPINIVHIGGVLNRVEYLAVGNPLVQAFHAEHAAVAGIPTVFFFFFFFFSFFLLLPIAAVQFFDPQTVENLGDVYFYCVVYGCFPHSRSHSLKRILR